MICRARRRLVALESSVFLAASIWIVQTQAVTAKSQHGPDPTAMPTPETGQAEGSDDKKTKSRATDSQRFDIDEYRVEGADHLPQIEVEEAVYPFLGPKRSSEDVEKARAALEKTYHDKGFQTVVVSIPRQSPQGGVIVLKVAENPVGRVRIVGSRYFDPKPIKKKAASLAEGTVPNFNAVTKDIIALNQWPDRRITPSLKAGITPGTVDVDLTVEDKLPFHGTIELNNRQAPSTTPLRVITTFHYDNLWQLGHSINFSYQVAPERPSDAEVFSGSYLARVPENDFVSLLLYGVSSSSNVAVVGGLNVIGPGQIVGSRAVLTLPTLENFYHTLSVGADYKHFAQTINNGPTGFSSPVTYAPIVASYNATWQSEGIMTLLSAGMTFGVRGIGSSPTAYDARRFDAQGNFVHFNTDFSHTQDLPLGLQIFTRLQGQLADQPLVSSEQFSAGGLDTVRGYLESEVLGDDGVAGTLEFRSPNLGPPIDAAFPAETSDSPKLGHINEWRVFGFLDAARVKVLQPLPEQQSIFNLWSYGIGTRLKLADHLNTMVVFAVPMIRQAYTKAMDPRVSFRVWGEF